jgi:hypothetical protein
MKSTVLAILIFLIANTFLAAQTYYTPTHYHGLFEGQPTNAEAYGMGLSMITLDGVANSIYNPATISPDSNRAELHINYAKGHSFYPTSHYPFVGASYKVLPKLTVAGTLFSYRMVDGVWTSQIGAKDFDDNGLKTQTMYSIAAAYEVIENLHLGVSGNFLKEKAIRGSVTNRDFILSIGTIYDREVNLLKGGEVFNQKVRVAGNFFNVLGNSVTMQRHEDRRNFRNLPVYLRLGTAYSFSVPVEAAFTDGLGYFEGQPRQLDFSLHLHMRDHLKTSETIHNNHEYGTAVGFGTEVRFLKRLSFRFGYYSKKLLVGEGTSGTRARRSGLTWGYGADIPLDLLGLKNSPFDLEINFITGNLMDELNDQVTHPSVFSDDKFLFAMGINLKMK